jgi:hypothetical protein
MPEFLGPSNDFAKEINWISTSTITAGNTQLVPLSTGLGFNVPTTKIYDFKVNDVSQATIGVNGLQLPTSQTLASSSAVSIYNVSNNLLFNIPTASGYGYYINGVQQFALAASGIHFNVAQTAAGGTVANIYRGASNDLRLAVVSGGSVGFDVAGTSYATITATGISFPTSMSAGSGSANYIGATSGYSTYNTQSATEHRFRVNGTNVVALGANGLLLMSAAGSVTGANREVVGTATGINYNTPTGTSHTIQVNGTSQLNISATGINFPVNQTAPTIGFWRYSSTELVHSVPTAGLFYWQINGSNTVSLSASTLGVSTTNGIAIGSTTGTISAGTKSITGTSTGLAFNTLTTTLFDFQIAGTSYFKLGGNGLLFTSTQTAQATNFSIWAGSSTLNLQCDNTTFCTLAGTQFISIVKNKGIVFDVAASSSLTGSDYAIYRSSIDLGYTVPTGGSHYFLNNGGFTTLAIIGPSLLTLSMANGIYLNSSTGTITGAQRQVAGTSAGVSYNTPAGLTHSLSVNNVEVASIGTAGITLAEAGYLTFGGSSALGTNGLVYAGGTTLSELNGFFTIESSQGIALNATGVPGIQVQNGVTRFGNGVPIETSIGPGTIYIQDSISVASVGDHGSPASGFGFFSKGVQFSAAGTTTGTERQVIGSSVGVSYNTPATKRHSFQVNGVEVAGIDATGLTLAVPEIVVPVIKTANYTMVAADSMLVADSVSSFTITLVAATGSGRMVSITNVNTGVLTVDANASETIIGSASQTLNQWETIKLWDYATGKWAVI